MGFVHLLSLTFLYGWSHLSSYFLNPSAATKQHVLIAMMMLESNKSVEMSMAMAMQNFLKWPLLAFFYHPSAGDCQSHQNGSHESSPSFLVQSCLA